MTPDQLKASILQYAMEGKLVPQDLDDEPASELLAKIQQEKAQLVKEKKIKKTKPLPEISEDEIPFAIPDSWKWVRLGDAAIVSSGGTPSKNKTDYWNEGNIPWITPAMMGKINGKIYNGEVGYINEVGLAKSSAQLISANSIVYSSRAPIGHINIVPFDYTTNQGCKSVTLIQGIVDFFYYALIERTPEIQVRASGTTFKEISGSKFAETLVPLPPLAEQKRIADKLDKIMPLIDEYAKSYTRLAEIDSSFNDRMKKSILQYAMEGKLVPQDPNDEPASELLAKIQQEKDQLVKEKKIKKSKPLPEISEDEIPFDIPDSWKWVRLGDLVNILSGRDMPKMLHLSTEEENSIPYITGASNIENGLISTQTWIKDPVTVAHYGDILLTVKGTVGKIAILKMSEAQIARQLMSLTVYPNIQKDYVVCFLNWYISELQSKAKSMIPGVTREDVSSGLVPLPPLAEQKRIVDKIDELFEILS